MAPFGPTARARLESHGELSNQFASSSHFVEQAMNRHGGGAQIDGPGKLKLHEHSYVASTSLPEAFR